MNRVHLGYVGDGTNYHVQKWLPALADAGIDVTLITFDAPDTDLPGVKVRLLRRPFRLQRANRYGRCNPRSRLKPRWMDYLLPSRHVRSILERERCDVLMGSYATHYGWIAARTRFKPFVLQTWTGDLTVYPFSGYRRLLFGPIVRYAVARADIVTTDGRALAERAHDLYPTAKNRFVPVRWGIDTDQLAHVDRTKRRISRIFDIRKIDGLTVVTSPRGLQHWYQPELVLRALNTILQGRQDVFVVLLTLGHETPPRVEDELQQLRLNPRALVIDRFLDTDALNGVWAATDVVLSIPHSDGISESVLESVYVGALPVLSRIPSNESLVRDGLDAMLADNDVDSVVRCLTNVLDIDPGEADAIRHRNKEWVAANATIAGTASHLVAMLEGVCRSSVVEE